MCDKCQRLEGFRKCEAFDEIPLEIWLGENKHRSHVPGDSGLTFLPFPPQNP